MGGVLDGSYRYIVQSIGLAYCPAYAALHLQLDCLMINHVLLDSLTLLMYMHVLLICSLLALYDTPVLCVHVSLGHCHMLLGSRPLAGGNLYAYLRGYSDSR